MEIGETVVKTSALTPKAILHQKYGTRASYKTEEIKESVGNGCPGLVIPQQSRILFRCCLKLPEFSVTSDTFTKKKDAEQAAAQLALEQLGIQPMKSNPTMQEIWDHLVYRLSYLFTDEFLSSSHPLTGHFRAAFQKEGELYGLQHCLVQFVLLKKNFGYGSRVHAFQRPCKHSLMGILFVQRVSK